MYFISIYGVSIEILSLDNKNKYIGGNLSNTWFNVYGRKGHFIHYSPHCSGMFSCDVVDGKFEGDFIQQTAGADILLGDKVQLHMDPYVEKNDLTKQLPEAYQDGKLIYSKFTLN